jgi:hypothetical protein
MSPADRQGSGFGETEMLDLARPDQILYRSGDVLDGTSGSTRYWYNRSRASVHRALL